MKKIVFTGGGTLGHVMPNLYLIEDLKDCEILYIGSSGIEKERVKQAKINYAEIDSVKLRRGKFFVNLKIPFVLVKAINQSKKILKEFKPDVIFSKGGYVSLPVCLAAKKLDIPIIAHESDSSFGLANRIILRLCSFMCVNFKTLTSKSYKIKYTGPIFSNKYDNKTKHTERLKLDATKPTILFVAGSLGSVKINDNLLPIIKDLLKDFNIIHITGKGNKKLKSYDNYNAIENTNEMVNLYNIADFVVGRSGAGITAEAYYKKLPMLLIPLENKASRGDQVLNAQYYCNLGVATILKEAELTPTKLYDEIIKFKANLKQYKEKYKQLNIQNGKEKVLKLLSTYLN